jgi:hypothetical protein
MRNEDRSFGHARRASHRVHDADAAPPDYLSPITAVAALTVAPDLQTAGETVHPDHTVETHTPLAAAS